MTRMLITGSNGFVGKVLCQRLVERDFDVLAVVRNIDKLVPANRSVCIAQINAETDWANQLVGVDVVIHLAARVHVMHETVSDSLSEFLSVNLHGTMCLAQQAVAAGVKRFVYVSTVKVHGECTDGHAFSEIDQPHPQDPYALSKWQAEQALQKLAQETGIELVILRPPLVYGAGVKANFLNLLKLVDRALPLPLGSFRNQRSMVYVENLVDAIITCSMAQKAVGQTFLVSDGNEVSTPQLIGYLARGLNRPNRIFSFPVVIMRLIAGLLGKATVIDRLSQSLEVDSSKIRTMLGWQPPFTMIQGLAATAIWYQSTKVK